MWNDLSFSPCGSYPRWSSGATPQPRCLRHWFGIGVFDCGDASAIPCHLCVRRGSLCSSLEVGSCCTSLQERVPHERNSKKGDETCIWKAAIHNYKPLGHLQRHDAYLADAGAPRNKDAIDAPAGGRVGVRVAPTLPTQASPLVNWKSYLVRLGSTSSLAGV